LKFNKILKIIIAFLLIAILGFFSAKWLVTEHFYAQYKTYNKQSLGKILIVWDRGIGEEETIARLKIAGNIINWQVFSVSARPPFYIRWFIKNSVTEVYNKVNPNFVITLQDFVKYYPFYPNYLTLTLGTDRYIQKDAQGYYLTNKEHAKFDAIFPSFQDLDKLELALQRGHKHFTGFAWYPLSNAVDYQFMGANKLFYSGGYLWDTTRSSSTYKDLFAMLDTTGYFTVCGPNKKWKEIAPNSAIGIIPIDGYSLIAEHNKAGMSLLLHYKQHLEGGAPTGRIFEAAAANTVIISDKHTFIIKNFADNVLYIDVENKTASEIFQQINSHVKWIKNHPELAKQMANNCHKIFMDKFTLEEQLLNLIKFYEDNLHIKNHPSNVE
jgi:hypothetical protein